MNSLINYLQYKTKTILFELRIIIIKILNPMLLFLMMLNLWIKLQATKFIATMVFLKLNMLIVPKMIVGFLLKLTQKVTLL